MITSSINQAIDFLALSQEKDSCFPSFTTADPANFENAYECRSIFSSALILLCLNELEETEKIKKIKTSLADFLLSQKSEHWTFNYWDRNSPDFKRMPYPDDLDDTSCTMAALYKYNPKLIGGEALAKFVSVLTYLESKEGGPYYSWLVGQDAPSVWRDIDLAVNANIAFFLSTQEVKLKNINQFIEKAILDQKYYSPYYPEAYSVIYFISRFYKGRKRKEIINFLLKNRKKDFSWGNSLDTALAVSAILNLGLKFPDLDKSIDYLLKKQKNGAWDAYSFYTGIDPSGKPDGTEYYAGSKELTTAFCAEALAKFLKQENSKAKKQKNSKAKKQAKILSKEIIKQAKNQFNNLDFDLKNLAALRLKKALKTDQDQPIILLPYLFSRMIGEKNKNLSEKFLSNLGLANLYGWIAYTIYDDFLDNEGDPKLLPLANICLRELSIIFAKILPENPEFLALFREIMNKLESANTWEASNCRLEVKNNKLGLAKFSPPNFNNLSHLAERSMGHALGPIAILFALNFKENSQEIKNLISFFKHYIIARQLNDDAHDFEADLKSGSLTYVSSLVLAKFKEKNNNKILDLKADLQKLQEIFWHEIIIEISEEVLSQAKKAKKALFKIDIIQDNKFFLDFLAKVEKAAEQALTEREKTLKFLENYGNI